jgi:hypothetical protein
MRHAGYFFNRYPSAWQSPTCKDSVMEYMADDIMPATFNLRLIYLKAFFEWAVKEKYIEEENHISMTKRYVNLSGNDLQEVHRQASPLNRLVSNYHGVNEVFKRQIERCC